MKKIILFLIIGIIVISCILIGLIIYMTRPQEQPITDLPTIEVDATIRAVTIEDEFFRVKNCIDRYVYAVNSLVTEQQNVSEQPEEGDFLFEYGEDFSTNCAEELLQLLGKDYKEENDMTAENIQNYYQQAQQETITTILHVYRADNTANVYTYFAYGIMRNVKNNQVEGISIMVVIDDKNNTFAIYPADYMQTHGFASMELGQELNLDPIESIEANAYNVMETIHITAETALQNDFQAYKELALYSRETAYTFLEEEYREKRFPTYEEYDQYIQQHYTEILGLSLEQYSKEMDEDTTLYICIDQNNHYYIFQAEGAMDFTVQLDTYTLDTSEFLTAYNAKDYKGRVILNLTKVQEAINQGDYRYVYNHLDETFLQNNFASLEDFGNYMRNAYYAQNAFALANYQEVGDIASCTVAITNQENTAQSKQQSFIMQLGEGTDYTMSFEL